MSAATLQQTLVYNGIAAINACVEKLPMAEAHEAIVQLREHLEARAEQTAASTLAGEAYGDEFADLLGVQP